VCGLVVIWPCAGWWWSGRVRAGGDLAVCGLVVIWPCAGWWW